MSTIHRSSQLSEFANFAHETYIATSLACGGLQRHAKQIGRSSPNPSNKIFVGSNRPGSGGPLAGVMKVRDLVKNSKKNGHFSNLLCSNALVAIYTEWEETYRKSIADELGLEVDKVVSDAMGDLRLIRQIIIHHRGIADKRLKKLVVLEWNYVEGEPLIITEKMFEEFMYALNADFNVFGKLSHADV